MKEAIAKRYVKALFKVSSTSEIESYLPSINNIVVGLTYEKFNEILFSSEVSKDKKVEFLLTILDSNDSKLVNFMKTIIEHKRVDIVPEIYKEIRYNLSLLSNVYEGTITSKDQIDDEVVEKIRVNFEKKIGSNLTLMQKRLDFEGIKLSVDELGLEVNFSKDRLKQDLAAHILKAI